MTVGGTPEKLGGVAAPGETIRGGCLCGAVAFELLPSRQYGPGREMGVCHCDRCRRWSGSASVPFVVVAPERFRVLSGQDLMAHYRGLDGEVRTFCRLCGSSLYRDTGGTYFVSAGVLECLRLRPAFHLHIADAAPWDDVDGNNTHHTDDRS